MTLDGRNLEWASCLNVRDLGGHAVPGGRETRRGAVVRADALDRLTSAGWDALLAHGVRHVVDLRAASELARRRGPREVEAHHVPLFEDEHWDTIHQADTIAALYGRMLEYCSASFARVVAAIGAAGRGGVVVHCQVGKDRTGLVTALLLSLAGVDRVDIAADYALSDARARPLFGEWIESAPTPELRERRRWLAGAPEAAMTATLELLQGRYGGAEAYLVGAGATRADLDAVRHKLLGRVPTA